MKETPNKAQSDPNLPDMEQRTPPSYVFKRPREPDYGDSDFLAFKEEIKSMMTTVLNSQEEIKQIYPTLMEIKTANTNIENAMTALSEQNSELKRKIEELELQARKDNDYIVILEDKIEDLQRESRKSSFEIKNVPKIAKVTKDELVNMVINLSEAVDCKIQSRDIKDIYRVQNKRTNAKMSTIIVDLGSTLLKTNLLQKSKEFNRKEKDKLRAKHLGFKTEEYSLYGDVH